MKKHVYQFNQYITKSQLINEVLPLISDENTYNQISRNLIEYLGIENSSLSNEEVIVQVVDQKKGIDSYLESFKFDVSKEDEKYRFIRKLENIGIKENSVNINELSKLINNILLNDVILNEFNKMRYFTYENITGILEQNGMFLSEKELKCLIILLNQILFNNLINGRSNCQPIKRTKYYNEKNELILKIQMEKSPTIFTTINKFEGEIYESLSFKDDNEAKQYQIDNGIKEQLLEDVVSFMHFNCESTLNDWYNDLTIIKYRMGCIYIDYGERLFIQNKKNNCSITSEEVESIIREFEYRDIDNEFIKYVINELEQFKNTLKGKEEQALIDKQSPIFQQVMSIRKYFMKKNKCIEEIKKILGDHTYGDEKTVYLKIKVVSDTPVCFVKQSQNVLK